jgi:hypothetical protein
VAGALDWCGDVDLMCLYHCGELFINNIMIVTGEEWSLSMTLIAELGYEISVS